MEDIFLDKLLREEILRLPLDEILIENGYSLKRNKSSKHYRALTNNNDDLVIINRYKNGHYLYFNPNEEKDRGNIFNFCKNRGISYAELFNTKLKESFRDLNTITHNLNPNSLEIKDIAALENFKNFNALRASNFLIHKRMLSPTTLESFNTIKQDSRGNICIPTYCLGKTTLQKKTNLFQKGYLCYLANPILKDKEGIAYPKPLKQICYGNKGLEVLSQSYTSQDKKPLIEEIQHIIIGESTLDTLSFFELNKEPLESLLLCSTNGQINANQQEIFGFLDKNATKAQIILVFDNDEKGQQLAQITKQCFKEKNQNQQIEIRLPLLKDFNEDLFIKKALNLRDNFTKEEITEALEELKAKIIYFESKKDILYPQSQEQAFKEAHIAALSLEYLKPKVQNYLPYENYTKAYQGFKEKYSMKNQQKR